VFLTLLITGLSQRIGTRVYNSLGLLFVRTPSLGSYLQPSSYIPLIYPPSGAASFICLGSNLSFISSNSKSTISIGCLYFLAKFCFKPVKNACGKKKPLIQKHFGVPLVSHSFKNLILSPRSLSQLVSGLIERNPHPFSSVHDEGTSFLSIHIPKSSSTWFMTMRPRFAFIYCLISTSIVFINALYLPHSWVKTVFILSEYEVGYFISINSKSNNFGILDWINNAFSSFTSSGDLPALATAVWDWIPYILANITSDLLWLVEMSALECKPKSSGDILS